MLAAQAVVTAIKNCPQSVRTRRAVVVWEAARAAWRGGEQCAGADGYRVGDAA